MSNKFLIGVLTTSISGVFLSGIYIGINYNKEINFTINKINSFLNNNNNNNNKTITSNTHTITNTITNTPHNNNNNNNNENSNKLLQDILLITKENEEYAILSTSNLNNIVNSRIIQPYPLEYNEKLNKYFIYFNTSRFSRKVKDMNENSNVSIIYPNFKKMSYVCFIGKVEKLPFPESSTYWKSSLNVIYPEGNHEDEDSRFTTWKIVPHTISVVDISNNLFSVRKDFRAPELQFNEENNSWIVTCDGKEESSTSSSF